MCRGHNVSDIRQNSHDVAEMPLVILSILGILYGVDSFLMTCTKLNISFDQRVLNTTSIFTLYEKLYGCDNGKISQEMISISYTLWPLQIQPRI